MVDGSDMLGKRMYEKEKLRKEEKKRIATAAAKLIEENDSIIIASGSSVRFPRAGLLRYY